MRLIDEKEPINKIDEQPTVHNIDKATGYERVPKGKGFYCIPPNDVPSFITDQHHLWDDGYYESANYYSSDVIAKNNARADRLMRQLRRFAVQHRKPGVDLNDIKTKKYYFYYDYDDNELRVSLLFSAKFFGAIYFDSEETAQAAINVFRDELIWYFTEYEDSL